MGLTRRFLFNEASWDGTCSSLSEFRERLKFCFECLKLLRSQGASLEVSYTFFSRPLLFSVNVREASAHLDNDQRRLLSLWADREGPFWDRPAAHSSDEYFECQEVIVTDTALAEASHLAFSGEHPVVVSLPNSSFSGDSVKVIWQESPQGTLEFEVTHADSLDRVREIAATCVSSFQNYRQFVDWAYTALPHLLIDSEKMLDQLGTTFVHAIMDRGRELLEILNAISESLLTGNQKEFDELCLKWLRSERFSDSSTSEKNDKTFTRRMTFSHPENKSSIVCYWHGKVRTGFYRLHFEWPPPLVGNRLFVAYFGPKLTKQ